MKNKLSTQSFWLLLKLVCIFLISVSTCLFCSQILKDKNYLVHGTVFSKNIEQYAHGKNYRNMSTQYVMCVKPDDIKKFKYYSVYVDYTTYCTHNVGDKIAFSVCEHKCLKDFKRSVWLEEISLVMLIVFGILAIFYFSAIISIIVEPYLNDL